MNVKKTTLAVALAGVLGMGIGTAQASQIACGSFCAPGSAASSTSNNNFTMLSSSGGVVGGATNVAMTWDGTVFTSSSDYTGPGSVSDMTLSSTTAFFGHPWTAHDIQVFAPGSYSFNTTLGGGATETGNLNMNVGAGQLGAHMLFNWNGNNNIDVAVVWDANGVFGNSSQQSLSGTGVWNAVSVDGNGDGVPGIPMVAGGPFAGFNANFNLNGITPAPVPIPAAVWLFGSGLLGLVGVGRRKRLS
ncbi:MAG: hypothetical protein B7Z74_00915 [Deltaproteobacteria bacterium 21-66-5]|nr:MAG: hypothetical protein B7Z74_00915 [Deltaproteobacteria bacterium 21-66-5]HQU17212.1 VPLPA-CTERM sorting domain-containing protein [Gammaproteobacteria bacterium]